MMKNTANFYAGDVYWYCCISNANYERQTVLKRQASNNSIIGNSK